MRFHAHLGLRTGFILVVSGVLLVTFVTVASILVVNANATTTANLNQDSMAFASLATPQIGSAYSIYQDSGSIIIDQQIQKFMNLDVNMSNVAVISLAGQVVFSQNPTPIVRPLSNGNSFDAVYSKDPGGFITEIVVPYLSNTGQHPFSIAYTISDQQLRQFINHQIADIIAFSILGLIISALILYVTMTHFFVTPIERVSRQALSISRGNYDQAVDVVRQDEIGDLASSVNSMSERLKADINSLREVDSLKNEFIAITSHNLRTPLTVINVSIESLDTSKMPASAARSIKIIGQSAHQLGDFAEDMLTIASVEAGHAVFQTERTTIANLTKDLQTNFDAVAKQKRVRLTWNITHNEAVVMASARHLRAVMRNLIDNALKFTNPGGSVDCSIKIQASNLVITVSDTGMGITPSEQAKLFTKFHRGTSTLQYDYSGTGIGLYVSKLIVDAHHGVIQVASRPDAGSTFKVTIPQSPA